MSLIEVTELRKSFREHFFRPSKEVLQGLSFQVEAGRITGFLGGNGAGKTTTLNCLLGLSRPDSGEVLFFQGQRLDRRLKERIGFLPERPFFYESLTGLEFLNYFGQLSKGRVSKDRMAQLLKKVDLWAAREQKLRTYSKGMLQKIGLVQALVHDPELVILDEPMSGLDPDGRYYLAELIRGAAAEGKTVFLSSHLLPDVEKLCESLVILRQGHCVYQGGVQAFLANVSAEMQVSYFFQGQKKQLVVSNEAELQKTLERLVRESCTIVEVRRHTGLESAFVKVGLRGEL